MYFYMCKSVFFYVYKEGIVKFLEQLLRLGIRNERIRFCSFGYFFLRVFFQEIIWFLECGFILYFMVNVVIRVVSSVKGLK